MMTDPIADMLTRIRNASMINKKEVCVPFSKIKMGVANILVENGYLQSAERKEDGLHPYILLMIKYDNGQPAITHIKRMSKPGRRFYIKKKNIRDVLNGFGMSVLSTPKGILSDKEAKKLDVGGELICEVY